MRKALIPLLLVLAVLTAGCFQLNFSSAPDGGDEPTTTLPGGGDDQPTTSLPIVGRFPVYIDGVEILLLESWPVQVKAVIRGTLPTPCHNLVWNLGEPGADGRIVLSVFSTVDLDQVCTQVLHPFEQTIDVGSFTSGAYTLIVNGVEYPFEI
ncbi:MAG: hypothetical protein MUE66_03760 [Acidimicrobiia bacterium]|jgi:hypothetical protein|nr:hypothetical protein [Acidimicrobiia bacterium]